MIGHTLAKLYGMVLEAELNIYAEVEVVRAPRQARFRGAVSTTNPYITLFGGPSKDINEAIV